MSKDGLCAIVTGSASGLGAATAAVLAKGGGQLLYRRRLEQRRQWQLFAEDFLDLGE